MIKTFKNRVISLFIAVLLIASTITMLTVSTPSSAQQNFTTDVPTAYLSARPRTLGVGQELLINFWVTPVPGTNRQYHNYTLTIIDPNGKSISYTMDSYVDGTMWMPYVFDKVGEWTIAFDYPGEYFAPGRYFDGEMITESTGGTLYADGVTVRPTSARPITINVQDDIVPSWPVSPLPTDYWTRPVNEENRFWWPIIGAYPWFGPGGGEMWDILYPNTNPYANSGYAFTPWVLGPESAHIAWKRQYALGGLMGGDVGIASSINTFTYAYSTMQSAFLNGYRMAPSLILMGRAYHTIEKPAVNGPGMQTYWECYDIRTGEVFWERPLYPGETAPTLIEYAFPDYTGTGWATEGQQYMPVLLSISNGHLMKYNAYSGLLMYNVSIAPMTGSGGTYYKNGYVLGIQDLGADAGSERYRLINWTTQGATANFAARVVSNTTYARSALPTGQLTDWNVGVGCTVTGISEGGIYKGMDMRAFDLCTGQLLWNKTIDEPIFYGSANVADHGKLAVLSARGYYLAFDLTTGHEVWRTESLDYPWDAAGLGALSITSGYGQIYWSAQTGIYAIDWDTGNINWKYEKEAPPFETPYTGGNGQTVYPFCVGSLCVDDKLYVYSGQYAPNSPFSRGSPTVCIDVFTGNEIWSIGMTGLLATDRAQMAVADGYLTLSGRDGYMYTFGKGLSEITVSAQQMLDRSVLLTGTILDLSPAQPDAPCVDKESMAALMEHLHMGVGIGGVFDNATMVGVPVYLSAVDPNGNSVEIGTVISDGYSGTFAYTWMPDIAGQYTITAAFIGDESYDSSSATTYITAAEGISTPPTDNTVLYAIIGATVAIIIVMIACFFLFRKK